MFFYFSTSDCTCCFQTTTQRPTIMDNNFPEHQHTVQMILVASAALAVPTIVRTLLLQRYRSSIVALCVMLATVLMHLSETKHGFRPLTPWLGRWSRGFLNLDRAAAFLGFFYGLWRLWPVDMYLDDNKALIVRLLFAALFSAMGEQTSEIPPYGVCHFVWHAIVFHAMYQVF